jgi:hypothetical protein
MAKKKAKTTSPACEVVAPPTGTEEVGVPVDLTGETTPEPDPEPTPPEERDVNNHPAAVQIELPLGEVGNGYLTNHVEVGGLNVPQRETLKRLFHGLDHAGARLANGKRVGSNADTIRWILEQIGQAGNT